MSEHEIDGAEVQPGATPVADAVAELDTLAQRDLADHPEVFERIHGELQNALRTIDDA